MVTVEIGIVENTEKTAFEIAPEMNVAGTLGQAEEKSAVKGVGIGDVKMFGKMRYGKWVEHDSHNKRDRQQNSYHYAKR